MKTQLKEIIRRLKKASPMLIVFTGIHLFAKYVLKIEPNYDFTNGTIFATLVIYLFSFN